MDETQDKMLRFSFLMGAITGFAWGAIFALIIVGLAA